MARLVYLELPAADRERSTSFYGAVFGWAFTDFGPTYGSTMSGDTDVGIQADPNEKTVAALPVIAVGDLEATLAAVTAAGGTITRAVFAFPGGRRFHFRDPDGHELAAMQPD